MTDDELKRKIYRAELVHAWLLTAAIIARAGGPAQARQAADLRCRLGRVETWLDAAWQGVPQLVHDPLDSDT